jgi:hypothetical protein
MPPLVKLCVIPLGVITISEQFEFEPGHSEAPTISFAITLRRMLVIGTSERAQPSSMGRRSSRKNILTNLAVIHMKVRVRVYAAKSVVKEK